MKSIKFPNFLGENSTKTVDDFEATKQNLFLLLHSEKGELFGDPFFGIRLKRYLFDQNDAILKDILIDEIYTAIITFMPQIQINRKDIQIVQDKNKVSCVFSAINKSNFKTNLYNLVLFETVV